MDLMQKAMVTLMDAPRQFLAADTKEQRELVALSRGRASVALEEASDGKVITEIEHVIYGKISDFDQLKEAASMESQEQWEVRIPQTEKNAGKGSIRCRKTTIAGGDPDYVLTTKIPTNKDGDKLELPLPSNEENFLQFKFLADQGMIKNRYHFPIVGTKLVWEVDVFPKPEGGYHEWCKIDLEVTDRDAIIPELPIQLDEIILPAGYGRQDEEKTAEFITRLYELYFISPNQFKNPTQPNTTEAQTVHTGTEETPAAPVVPETPAPPPEVQSANELPENMTEPSPDLDPNLPETA